MTNNDSAPSVPSPDKREVATFVMRLLGFAVTLAVIGTFFLPWLRLDGAAEARSGVALPTIAATPMVEYLFAVAPAQAGVLVGCPVVMFVFAVRVALAYARRRTAVASTVIVLAAALALVYGTRAIADSHDPIQSGLVGVISLSVVLLVHQLLIKLSRRLLESRRFPALYRGLTTVTGTGRYRWRDARSMPDVPRATGRN